MHAYQVESWADFAVAVASAASALAGLLFVALSINLEGILAGRGLTARAGHTLILLSTPLVIGLLLLIPGQSEHALGVELLILGIVSGASLAALNRPGKRAAEQPLISWAVSEAAPALLLAGSTTLAGTGLVVHALGGLYWVPAGIIAAFVGALLNAWALLIEILR